MRYVRWKGENVATYEVANTITKLPFIHAANVYGVEVPGIKNNNMYMYCIIRVLDARNSREM